MFSIYEYDRRIFRNTLEELYKVKPVLSTRQLGKDRKILLDEDKRADSKSSYLPSSSAIKAYKELVNINPKDQIYHAYEIMETVYEYVSERGSAAEAVKKLTEGQYDILPVLSADKRVVGLFTYDLVFRKLTDYEVGINSVMLNPVSSFIGDKVITAEAVTSIRRIAEVMYRYNLRIMPIIDAYETVIGVVSYREVLNAISNDPPVSVWT